MATERRVICVVHVQYYHEPGTGRKFRSLASVKRYLEEMDAHGIRRDVSPLSLTFPGVDNGSKCYAKPGSFMKTLQGKSASQIVVCLHCCFMYSVIEKCPLTGLS